MDLFFSEEGRRPRPVGRRVWALPGLVILTGIGPAFYVSLSLGMMLTSVFLAVWATVALWGMSVRGPGPAALTLLVPLLGAPWWQVPLAELDGACRTTLDVARSRGIREVADGELRAWSMVHLGMIAGAWVVGMPEVAAEAWGLHQPGGPREAVSDFAVRDPAVRQALRGFAVQARASSGPFEERNLSWPDYGRDDRSLRVALALNCPLYLGGHSEPGPDPMLHLVARCKVDYPASAPLVLARKGGHRITLDEGVFNVLEERGWLHPYEARWTWSMRASDPRLDDTTVALRSWRERLFTSVTAVLGGG